MEAVTGTLKSQPVLVGRTADHDLKVSTLVVFRGSSCNGEVGMFIDIAYQRRFM